MDKARQILEQALSYKNCDGLIEENSRLEDAVLYAINQALCQQPVSGSVCQCKVNRMIVRHEDKDWCNSCGEIVKAN